MKIYTLTLLGIFGAASVVGAEINESMDAAAGGTVSITNVAGCRWTDADFRTSVREFWQHVQPGTGLSGRETNSGGKA